MGKKKVYAVVALLSVALMLPIAFSSGVVNMVGYLFSGNTAMFASSSSSTPRVFVDPVEVIDCHLQSGSRFTVHVNVSDVTDLFSWHVNVTWDPAILNFSRVKEYGPFLRDTTSPNGTSGWIDRDPTKNVTFAFFNNTLGFAGIAETILDSRPEAAGVSGSGRLVSIEFLVVGYGYTDLDINLTGALATTLLSSTGGVIALLPENVSNGYFSNKIPGDVNSDGIVNIGDIGVVSAHWYPGPPIGPLGYDPTVDINSDGAINIGEIGIVSAYWTGPPKGPLAP